MARIPYRDKDDLPPDSQWLFDRLASAGHGAVPNIFRALAHNPGVMHQYMRLGTHLRQRTQLDPAVRELAILLVGKLAGCNYEFVHHVEIGKQAGVRPAQIEQLDNWRDSAAFTERERIALAFTESLTLDASVPPATFDALAPLFNTQEIVELTLNVAFYAMTVRFLNAMQVDIEQEYPS